MILNKSLDKYWYWFSGQKNIKQCWYWYWYCTILWMDIDWHALLNIYWFLYRIRCLANRDGQNRVFLFQNQYQKYWNGQIKTKSNSRFLKTLNYYQYQYQYSWNGCNFVKINIKILESLQKHIYKIQVLLICFY